MLDMSNFHNIYYKVQLQKSHRKAIMFSRFRCNNYTNRLSKCAI